MIAYASYLLQIKKHAALIIVRQNVLVYIASETRGGSVEQIYLLGSLARLSGIDQVLDNLISIPVKTINPFIYFSREHETNKFDDLGPVSGIAVAAGLALRAD